VTEAEVEAINDEASVLMKRGIALMEEPRREAAIDALHCFDEALALRRRVPAAHAPSQAYLLAACLLNRGDALVRMNDVGPLAAALASYEEGIDIMRARPLAADARYPRLLAVAYQNRGLALQARGHDGDIAAAATAFADALAVLDHEQSAAIEDRDYFRAVVWLNLANVLAAGATDDDGAHAAAHDAATRAIGYVAGNEGTHPPAAEAGLRARHLLCRLCAHRLSQATGEEMPEDVHQATDAVDDGLALVRSWEQRGGTWFRPLALDLFRFGARVYAHYQPQFLEEFIEDNLDPAQSSTGYVESREMVAAAQDARELIPPDQA